MPKLTKDEYMTLRTAFSEVLAKFPDLDSDNLESTLIGIEEFSENLDSKLLEGTA